MAKYKRTMMGPVEATQFTGSNGAEVPGAVLKETEGGACQVWGVETLNGFIQLIPTDWVVREEGATSYHIIKGLVFARMYNKIEENVLVTSEKKEA